MPRFIKYTLWIIASLLLTVAIQTAWYEFRVWRGWSELYATAEQFGYTPDAEIVASRSCYGSTMWIPPSTECHLYLTFRTDVMLSGFQQILDGQGIGSRTLGGTSPYTLHNEINLNNNSRFTLTLDGLDGSKRFINGRFEPTHSKFDDIRVYSFFKHLSNDELTMISFFDLKNVRWHVELNGEPFTQNIVILSQDIGSHSALALMFNPNNFPRQAD